MPLESRSTVTCKLQEVELIASLSERDGYWHIPSGIGTCIYYRNLEKYRSQGIATLFFHNQNSYKTIEVNNLKFPACP